MSSLWISTNLRCDALVLVKTSACTAFTSDDFPVPLAPHNKALLAGKFSAKFKVFFNNISFWCFIPWSKDKGIRLISSTGLSKPVLESKTKPSPWFKLFIFFQVEQFSLVQLLFFLKTNQYFYRSYLMPKNVKL